MEIFIILPLIIFALGIARRFFGVSKPQSQPRLRERKVYRYFEKEHVMTRSEESFFKLLNEIVGDKYYVFPQIHLSALLENEVKGQNWTAAFKHINGKSVDYVLCNKITLKTICAIELDDSTHYRQNRIKRDKEVEAIFNSAHITLLRFTTEESRDRIFIKNRILRLH